MPLYAYIYIYSLIDSIFSLPGIENSHVLSALFCPWNMYWFPWKVKISYFCTYESKFMDISCLVFSMNVGWNLYEKRAYEILTFHISTLMNNVWNFYEMSMKNLQVSWTKELVVLVNRTIMSWLQSHTNYAG